MFRNQNLILISEHSNNNSILPPKILQRCFYRIYSKRTFSLHTELQHSQIPQTFANPIHNMHPPTKRTRRCLTGVSIACEPHSDELRTYAEALGARYILELTPQTTYLLTDTAGSVQHRKAQTQKTITLTQEWLKTCYKGMMNAPTHPYLLPPLKGLVICCSGLDASTKAAMKQLCDDTGARYSRTLGKDCTHLLCDVPTGKKFDFAKTQGIRIVRSRWLKECADNNTLRDEQGFLLLSEDGGMDTGTGTGTATGTEVPASGVPGTQPSEQPERQRVLSDDGFASLLDGAVLYFPPSVVSDRMKHAPLHTKGVRLAARLGATVSSTLSSLVTHIIVLRSPLPVTAQRALDSATAIVTTLTWLERISKTGKLTIPDTYTPPGMIRGEAVTTRQESRTFLGVRACVGPLALRDASAAKSVTSVMISGRGKVLSHDTGGYAIHGVPTHVICPPDLRASERCIVTRAQGENVHVVVVTPFWVEMCASAEKLLPVNSCILFSPLSCGVPVEGLRGLGLTISGFQKGRNWDYRREVLRKVGMLLGCRYSERMRRRGTRVLIAEKEESEKVTRAKEWDIEVVRAGWLLACAREGRLVDFNGWRLGDRDAEAEGEQEVGETIRVFERFKDGIEASDGVVEERRRVRSRSVSRDEWSMDASQSQLIVHRDLTPPLSGPS